MRWWFYSFCNFKKIVQKAKVHIFWEGHKILRNLHLKFDYSTHSQILCGDFAKFCGLLRIYELYEQEWILMPWYLLLFLFSKENWRSVNLRIVSPKIWTKNSNDFCPVSGTVKGRNPSYFGRNDDFKHKFILKFTDL